MTAHIAAGGAGRGRFGGCPRGWDPYQCFPKTVRPGFAVSPVMTAPIRAPSLQRLVSDA